MNLSDQLGPRIPNWAFKYFKKVEIISLIIIVIGMILKISSIQIGNVLLTLSISTLSVFSFFRAYKEFEDASRIEILLNKFLPYGWAISLIAILFLIQGWPGFEPMLLTGSAIQIVLLIVILFLKEVKGIKYPSIDKSVLLRTIIITSLAISLYFCPKEILIKNNIIAKQVELPQN